MKNQTIKTKDLREAIIEIGKTAQKLYDKTQNELERAFLLGHINTAASLVYAHDHGKKGVISYNYKEILENYKEVQETFEQFEKIQKALEGIDTNTIDKIAEILKGI